MLSLSCPSAALAGGGRRTAEWHWLPLAGAVPQRWEEAGDSASWGQAAFSALTPRSSSSFLLLRQTRAELRAWALSLPRVGLIADECVGYVDAGALQLQKARQLRL